MGVKWSEMTPRERDALVAVKVMGWEVVRGTVVPPGYESWSKPEVPSYTTDICAAWEVVEMMKRMDEHVRYHFDDLTCERYCIWELTPEIICKAALKAMGVDVE
jgi:starvation-inducible outer membrane lipoprotein